MSFTALMFQNVPPAPGRETTAAPAAPAEPPPAHPDQGMSIVPLLIMVVPLLLFMMFTSRSQQKKQAAVIASLQKGDRVLTQGGIVGKLVELGDRYAKVEVAPGVKVEVLKTGLLGKDSAETAAALEKK